MLKNIITSRQSRCHFDVYHFNDQSISSADLDASYYGLYNDIISMTYTNNLLNPAGSWNIKLVPTVDYSKFISPGDWVQCFLTTSDGRKYKRFIGNVDRVAFEQTMMEDGSREILFSVYGRDWGKVFQDTTIWFNPYTRALVEPTFINKINGPDGSPNKLIKNLIDLFLNDTTQISNCSSSMNYWYISDRMAQDLGVSGHPQFADLLDTTDLDKDYPGYKLIPLFNTQGNLWAVLKSFSNELIYTMFCEMVDEEKNQEVISRPKLFFSARPYTFKEWPEKKIPLAYFLDLPSVEITRDDIISTNIGINDHDRFNLFFIQMREQPIWEATQAAIYSEASSPAINVPSIKRHGLRLFNRVLDYNLLDSNQSFAPDLYKEAIELLVHWYKGNHLLENGTFEIIGNPGVRLGKRLIIKDNPVLPDRQYYIESYTDSWSYMDIWRQSIEVTRGVVVKDGKEKYAYEHGSGLYPVTVY